MQKTMIIRPEIKLAGIKVRTNNMAEKNWQEGKIFPCVQKYFQKGLSEIIPNRKNPGTTFCVYAEYESDHHGDYTYLIGEEITDEKELAADLEVLIIPAQTYIKFTTESAAMPDVLKNAWQSIWQMSTAELGGKRRYAADFEIYDERAADHQNIVLDIFIGIE